jgi:hypothetical protein
LGVYASILGDPVPSFFGVNLGYNLGDIARIHAGYGSLATGLVNGTAYGGGVKFFVPGWGFSPFVGAQYSVFNVDSVLGVTLPGGVNSGAGVFSVGAGLDWQTSFGFHLSAGGYMPMGTSSGQLIPGVNLGWFF